MRLTKQLIIFLLPILLLGGCSLPAAPDTALKDGVSGKLMVAGQPQAGAWLEAYPATTASLGGQAPFRSGKTGADGRYRLGLPPGEYYLFGRGDGLFCYYGRNPVSVPEGGLRDLNLSLVAEDASRPDNEPFIDSGVLGRVSHQGRALPGATIYAYLDLHSQLKGMGYVMVGPTGPDGIFEASLPAGRYYLLARKRQSGSSVGPLSAGDFVGYYPGNPVQVGEGEVLRFSIPMLEVPEKVDKLAASLFGSTVLRGVIRDTDGQPLAGVRAVLYDDPQMLNRPLYVSQPTGADGAFVLSFPHGGSYYLAARNTLGGAPAPGDLYGTWDGNPDHVLKIKTGQSRDGLEIKMEKIW